MLGTAIGLVLLRDRSGASAPRRQAAARGVSDAIRRRVPRDRARDVRALRPAARRAPQVQHAHADEIRARVEFEGDERVRQALAAGKGVLLFSGHFGYWELQGIAHPLVLPPMSVLARPLDNPYLHRLLERMRCATGNHVIYRQGAVRRVLRALEADECVAMLIDQHIPAGRRGRRSISSTGRRPRRRRWRRWRCARARRWCRSSRCRCPDGRCR